MPVKLAWPEGGRLGLGEAVGRLANSAKRFRLVRIRALGVDVTILTLSRIE
jgi:hypothetical protein